MPLRPPLRRRTREPQPAGRVKPRRPLQVQARRANFRAANSSHTDAARLILIHFGSPNLPVRRSAFGAEAAAAARQRRLSGRAGRRRMLQLKFNIPRPTLRRKPRLESARQGSKSRRRVRHNRTGSWLSLSAWLAAPAAPRRKLDTDKHFAHFEPLTERPYPAPANLAARCWLPLGAAIAP